MRRLRFVLGLTFLAAVFTVFVKNVSSRDAPNWDHQPKGDLLAQLERIREKEEELSISFLQAQENAVAIVEQRGKSEVQPGGCAGSMVDVPVIWAAPLYGGVVQGIAEEAANLIIPLLACIPKFSHYGYLSDNFHNSLATDSDRAIIRKMHATDEDVVPPAVEGRPIYVTQWDPNFFKKYAGAAWDSLRFRIGRAMYETTGMPPGWAAKCAEMDEIWIPSQWGVENFARLGVPRAKLRAVPESLDAALFNPEIVPRNKSAVFPGAPSSDFVFLAVFKWESRKNPIGLLRAFLEEFAADDGVVLHVLTRAPTGALEQVLEDLVRDAPRAPKGVRRADQRLYVVPRVPTLLMPTLYRSADAFVTATHGEGWGRPLFEAMAMGTPTVAPYWSGQTAYLTNETAYLIPVTRLESAQHADNFGDTAGHEWAHVDIAELRRAMREVYVDTTENGGERAKAVSKAASEDIRRRFSREAVTKIITERLADIARFVT